MRNICFFNSTTYCFPGAIATEISGKLQDIFQTLPQTIKCLVMHIQTNKVIRGQSEVPRSNFNTLFTVMKDCRKLVIVSGPSWRRAFSGGSSSSILGSRLLAPPMVFTHPVLPLRSALQTLPTTATPLTGHSCHLHPLTIISPGLLLPKILLLSLLSIDQKKQSRSSSGQNAKTLIFILTQDERSEKRLLLLWRKMNTP